MPDADAKRTAMLRAYGWLFLASGAVFLVRPALLTEALGMLAAHLPGARPPAGAAPSLWLGLTGSMMAMISLLAFALARDPGQAIAWDALLLSKGCSTLLFALFALTERNAVFLLGSAVDGPIFLHLLYLRVRADERCGEVAADPWRSRFARLTPCGYEVWFIKLNDPRSRDALWLRYALRRTPEKAEGSCWYVLFDAENRRLEQGRWEGALAPAAAGELCRIGRSVLRRDGARAAGPDASWDIAWEPGAPPPFSFVPDILYRLGVAGTLYGTPLPSGKFRGEACIAGRKFALADAVGGVGHLWGRRMGDNWRWAHAVFPAEAAVFEILSAQGKAGGLRTPRWTAAHLWYQGKHYRSAGLCRGFFNSTAEEGRGWTFSADFADFRVEGECCCAPDMVAALEYADVDGRRLVCRNSKTGSLRLSIIGRDGRTLGRLATNDTAAVETVAGAI
ncbi:MAG: hypothetical protein ABIJ96_05050 [Elusimicrobiota bacterium]